MFVTSCRPYTRLVNFLIIEFRLKGMTGEKTQVGLKSGLRESLSLYCYGEFFSSYRISSEANLMRLGFE